MCSSDLTAAGVLLFDGCMLVLANACINTLRGGMRSISVYEGAEVSGPVVSVSDVCEWENIPGMYITSANWQDGDPALPVISDDQQTVQLGDKCGELTVTVSTSPEWINLNDAVTVTVEPQA